MNNADISKVISNMDKHLHSQVKALLLEGKPVSLSIIQQHDDLVALTDGLLTDRLEYLNVYVHHSDIEELRARAEMMDL